MLEGFLNQSKGEQTTLEQGYGELARILNSPESQELQSDLQSELSEGTES